MRSVTPRCGWRQRLERAYDRPISVGLCVASAAWLVTAAILLVMLLT